MILRHDPETTWIHAVAHHFRSHGIPVSDGIWPGDELPAECLEIAGHRALVVCLDLDWSRIEAVNAGCPKRWALCWAAVAVSTTSGEMRVCSRARGGWTPIRTLDRRGMPSIHIAIPLASWHPVASMVAHLQREQR